MQESNISRPNLIILFLSIFLVGIGFSIIIPVLPFYAQSMGASALQLGLLMTVYALCQFIFSPVWGRYSDRVGRRPVLLLGLLGFAITFILFGFATQLWMLFAVRIAGGILSCATLPTAMAYVGDSTSIEKRGATLGLVGASMGMGMIFGPALGGLLSHYSLHLPFLAAGFLAVLNFIAAYLWVKESLPLDQVSATRERAPLLGSLKTPLAVFFVIILLVSIADASHQGTFALYAEMKIGFDAVKTGWSFALAGLVTVLVQGLLVGRMIDGLGEERTAKTGIIISALAFALFLYANNLWTIIGCMAIYAAGIGLVRPALTSRVSKEAGDKQGVSLGMLQSYDSLGRVIGPTAGGFLLDLNLAYAYVMAVVFAILGFVIMGSVIKKLDSGEGLR